jgi:cytochrome c oxidase assembly factor CtaG
MKGAAAMAHWTFEPFTVALLILTSVLYVVGVRAAWRHAGRGAVVRVWQAAAFAGGMLALAIAQVSPLAWLSALLFSAHMTQHEVLMLIAAPLLVLGHPLLAFLWAVPHTHRARVAAAVRRPAVVRSWRVLTGPLAVFLLHALALWIWHVPALFEAALAHEGIHFFQHMCFLLTAALFWWGMAYGRYGRLGYGVAVLYVFMTALHNTVLGALLTIAPSTWYSAYDFSAAKLRVDALADQQLAGLIMWIPSGVVFLVVGLALAAAWLGESERRVTLARTRLPTSRTILLLPLLALVTACGAGAGVREEARTLTGGEPDRGVAAIGRYGCGSCHTIPGIRGATGSVGPPLAAIASRGYLAGQLSNSPSNMMRWIQHPQHVERGTAMPEMGVTENDARDITAYLYTLR